MTKDQPFLSPEFRRQIAPHIGLMAAERGFWDNDESIPVSDATAMACLTEKKFEIPFMRAIEVFEKFLEVNPKELSALPT